MKKITEGPAAVDRSAPAQRPQTTIQWSVTQPRYTMEDILLDETTRAQLLDVVSYFQNQELLFHQWGLAERFSSQSGLAVNLYGPPGTGKTMAAHAITSALEKQMICVDYAEIESKYEGETSKNLSRLFQTAKEQDTVIFFKEGQLLPYSGQGEEQRYLTGTFVTGCEALFLKEGAATKQEFAQVCAQADAVRRLGLSGRRLASLVLERLLARGEVEKVELADLGEDLYVAKNQRSDAKMTRREISLD